MNRELTVTRTKSKPPAVSDSKPPTKARPKKPAGKTNRRTPSDRPGEAIDAAVAELAANPRFAGWKPDRLRAAAVAAIRLRGADDPAERDTLEAWLLTGLTVGEVASKAGLPIDVVDAYAALYLDVLGRLRTDDDRDALAWRLLGDQLHVGIPEADVGAWKRYAGLTGADVLQAFLAYLAARPLAVPHDVSGLSDAELVRLRGLLTTRRWVLSHAPINTAAQRMRLDFVYLLAEQQRL
jgi:hypothetical protein